MPIRKYKPVTPGRRQMTVLTFDEITTDTPHGPLTETSPPIFTMNTPLNSAPIRSLPAWCVSSSAGETGMRSIV